MLPDGAGAIKMGLCNWVRWVYVIMIMVFLSYGLVKISHYIIIIIIILLERSRLTAEPCSQLSGASV